MSGGLSLPASLWAATAEPAITAPPLTGETQADVAIVGGGFTGLSAALHLAEAGMSVVLVESGEPGWGASGRNGGQVIPGLKYDPDELLAMFGAARGERIVSMAGTTADLVFELIGQYRIACDAHRRGWIQAAPSETGLAAAQRRVTQWHRRGALVELLDRRAIAARLGTDRYAGGWPANSPERFP